MSPSATWRHWSGFGATCPDHQLLDGARPSRRHPRSQHTSPSELMAVPVPGLRPATWPSLAASPGRPGCARRLRSPLCGSTPRLPACGAGGERGAALSAGRASPEHLLKLMDVMPDICQAVIQARGDLDGDKASIVRTALGSGLRSVP